MTMAQSEHEDDLVSAIKRRQWTSLLISALVTLALGAGITVFLLYSIHKLDDLQSQVAQKTIELGEAQAKLDAARRQLASLEKQISDASDLMGQLLPLKDKMGMLKLLASRHPRAERLLSRILELQHRVHWGLQNTVQGGFTSPGFADFVLKGVTQGEKDFASLPLRDGPPHLGDVIRYETGYTETGYTMFYFAWPSHGPGPGGQREEAFVVGMTPFGIGSLKPDFGPRVLEVRITPFSE